MSDDRRRRLPLSELLYYQKPSLGGSNKRGGKLQKHPLQVAFPSGAIGIALSSSTAATDAESDNEDSIVIASETENEEIDINERRWLTVGFIILGIINLTITCLMFQHADTADPSTVIEPATNTGNKLPEPFQAIGAERSSNENTYFAFIVVSIIFGSISATFQSALGLSIYGLTTVIMYFVGTAAQPYFVFSFRSLFDIWMLYIALVLRSKLLFSILPLRIKSGW